MQCFLTILKILQQFEGLRVAWESQKLNPRTIYMLSAPLTVQYGNDTVAPGGCMLSSETDATSNVLFFTYHVLG